MDFPPLSVWPLVISFSSRRKHIYHKAKRFPNQLAIFSTLSRREANNRFIICIDIWSNTFVMKRSKMNFNFWVNDRFDQEFFFGCRTKIFHFFLIAAVDYILTHPVEPVDAKALEESAGIGVTVTPEEIKRVIEEVITQHKAELLEQRYNFSVGTLLGEVRKRLKWADGKAVKDEMDAQVRRFSLPNIRANCTKPFFFVSYLACWARKNNNQERPLQQRNQR